MDAVILLNKPMDMTSFTAVRKCRGIFHEKKAGHTGTLDPNASGLMIVLLGKYTKLVPYCVCDHKHYEAEFKLGTLTDTGDVWGTVIEERKYTQHSPEELENACQSLTGEIQQVPPMYSAIKINGQKLYDLARKGIVVERKSRNVTVSSLTVEHVHDNTYRMDAIVSSGTYIRTLIADYASAIGEVGTMTKLVRSGIEGLSLGDSATLEEIEQGKGMIDPLTIISPEWPFFEINEKEMLDVMNGKTIRLNGTSSQHILVHEGEMIAAYKKERDGYYHCVRGLR